jgi:hypothetical protein
VRPRAVKLRGADRTDADLVKQHRDGALDEPLELALQVVGLGLEHQDTTSGVAQRDDGRAVLVGVRRQRAQPCAAMDELVGRDVAQLVAQFFAGGDDQGFDVVDRLGARSHRSAARDEQYPDRFAIAATPRLREVLAAERFVRGADRVKLVGLRAVAARRSCGAVDFDDPFVVREQERRQTGAVAAAGFNRPDAPARGVHPCEAQQTLVAKGVGRDRSIDEYLAGARDDDGRRVRVAVRVDADDVIHSLCERAHRDLPGGG